MSARLVLPRRALAALAAAALLSGVLRAQDTTRVQGVPPIQGTPPIGGTAPIRGTAPLSDTAHVQDTTAVRPVSPMQSNPRLDSAEALFTQANAAAPDDAEDAYRRIIVEYPESPRAEQALLRLAQLELARGDRVQATAHLNQLTRDHTTRGSAAAATEFAVGEAYFQLDDLPHACPMLTAAKGDVVATDVELANRINYALERCRTAPPPLPPPPPPPPPSASPHPTPHVVDTARTKRPPAAATHKPAPVVPAKSSVLHGGYTVQVAALKTRAEADSLSHKLAARGYDVRVVGTQPLYRVRIGRYRTEADAGAERATLAAHGLTGFVTAAEP